MVYKGTVLTIEGNRARVAPMEDLSAVSGFYNIPPHLCVDHYERMADKTTDAELAEALRKTADERRLRKGDTVAFVGFSDYTGVILAKLQEV